MLKLCELGGEGCEGKKPLGGSEKNKFEGKERNEEIRMNKELRVEEDKKCSLEDREVDITFVFYRRRFSK